MTGGHYSHHNNHRQNLPQHQYAGYHIPQNQPGWREESQQYAGSINRQPQQQPQHRNQEALPPGWVEATDPSSGKVYYCNPQTRETKWERPTVVTTNTTASATKPLQSGNSRAISGNLAGSHQKTTPNESQRQQQQLPPGWVEAKDPASGKIYFCNPQTRETKWERPTSTISTELTARSKIEGNRNSYQSRSNSTGHQGVSDDPVMNVNTNTDRGSNQSMPSSKMATATDAAKNMNMDGQNADDQHFNELQSLSAGQIAHLIKLQQRQQSAQQFDPPKDRQVEMNNKPLQDSSKYVPIHLSLMSSLSATERTEPGRLDVRMYALREELKRFGYKN